jgi:hypothetical protein
VLEVEPVEAPAAGAFDFEYVDFANPKPQGRYRGEDARLLRLIPFALSHVVIRPEGPLVLINAHSQELVELTLAKGTVGARARLRDAALKHVATTAWRAILDEALACCMRTGEDGARSAAPLGDGHWSTQALERAAKESHRGGTLDDLLEDLCSDELRPGLLAFLAERLGSISRDPWQKLLEELTS